MQSEYNITSDNTTEPEELANNDNGLGEFIDAFSSKDAKKTHPLFNMFTCLFAIGLLGFLASIIIRTYLSEYSPLEAMLAGFGGILMIVFGITSIIRIGIYYLYTTPFIKNIYIFSDGFIWEVYRKNKLKSRRVFNYNSDVGDVGLTRTDNYYQGFYINSHYSFRVVYYNFEKEKWKTFKLCANERNRHDNPEKRTWLVPPMILIYEIWVRHV